MRCQVCNKEAGPEGTVCGYCGATVKSILGKGMPIVIPDEELRERGEKRRRRAERLRHRTRDHAVAGAVIVLAVNVLIWILRGIMAIGAVVLSGQFRRLPPGEAGSVWGLVLNMFLAVVTAAVMAVVFGAPAGYVISKRNAGPVGGSFLGAGMFAVAFPLLHVWAIVGAQNPSIALLVHFIIGGAVGLVTGLLIGYHVQGDSA